MQLDEGQSEAAINRYLYEAGVDVTEFERRRKLVLDAVAHICDMTWLQLYQHWDEVTIPGAVAMALTPEEIMTWRVVLERPGLVQIMYVGRAPLD